MKMAIVLVAALASFPGQRMQAQGPSGKAVNTRPIESLQGPELFKAYCASCHGISATGDGPVSVALKTKPADLTGIQKRNKGVFPLDKVRKVILGEEPGLAGHGSMEMPVWGPIFSRVTFTEKTGDVDLGRVRADNLARYLRDIQK